MRRDTITAGTFWFQKLENWKKDIEIWHKLMDVATDNRILKILKKLKKPTTDCRSKRIIAIIHCILNQNSRDPGAARFPAGNTEIIDILMKKNIGIMQLPCPEMFCLGLERKRPAGTRIREILDTPEGRQCCRELSVDAANQMAEFSKYGCRVFAVIGGDVESPGCAVQPQYVPGNVQELNDRAGVFLKLLWVALKERDIHIPFIGLRESTPVNYQADIACLKRMVA